MESITCPGLPASWVNAWLAAVGATRLDRRVRLHWTEGFTPVAVLSADGVHPLETLVSSWPTHDQIEDLPLASDWRDTPPLRRIVTVGDFAARARVSRRHPHAWTLSSTLTDLALDENGRVAHAPFDPPAPRGIWLHERLRALHQKVEVSPGRIAETLAGQAARVQANGLGFDLARLGSLADKTDPHVDPALEVMAFFGLALLPMRGTGHGEGTGMQSDRSRTQRGWSSVKRRQGMNFEWPAWSQRLDFQGIDALLDAWSPQDKLSWSLLGIRAGWRTVGYRGRDRSDVTRAFGSDRL